MDNDFSKNSDKEIKEKMAQWSDSMFTRTAQGADINSVMLFTPLIQLAQNELTSRYMKRTTLIAIGISSVALVVSLTALLVSI
jgi:hypothetical protein